MGANEHCRRKHECIYALHSSRENSEILCGYMYLTGEPRGCPAWACDKFKSFDEVKDVVKERRKP
ncbi:MAG: hypothetical protein IJ737_06990 [Ruminococcus sp.]|nr:hypothetical protein [Ruminococcus sp.]